MRVRTVVDADLRAFHTDPINDPAVNEGRHEHVWNVQLVFDGDVFRDARPLRAALLSVLDTYQGRDLPWWSGEDMAKAFLCIGTADPIGCIVTRPGYRAEVWREATPTRALVKDGWAEGVAAHADDYRYIGDR